jgi:hypothetical protein
MKVKVLGIFFALFLLMITYQSDAQFDRERFGKNRIQHSYIDWYHYTSNNFEVYYYDGGMNNARMAIDYLEGNLTD